MVAPHSPLGNEAVRRVATHASESAHWYDRDARLVLEVAGAKGQPVRPDLRHARKLDLCRGITSILACSAKPQLELWRIRQGILSALTLARHDAETESEWLRRVEEDMQQTAQKAAEEGTRIHAAIQAHVQGEPFDPAYAPHVEGAMQALDAVCGPQGWRSEVPVVSPLGYGTKLDLVSDEWLVDFKGKDGDAAALAELDTYEDHHMQVGAGIAASSTFAVGSSPRGAICFVSRTHPGVSRAVEIPRDKLIRGFAMFRGLLAYSQAKDSYRPSWARD